MKLLTFLACASLAQAKQPNILFLFSDDHALRSISAYGGDLAKIAPAPNIDRLAAEGQRWTSFYASELGRCFVP